MISFEAVLENIKGTYLSAWYIIDYTEYFYQRHSYLTAKSKVPFIQAKAPCYNITYVVTWVVTFISNLWAESLSEKEIVQRISSPNEALWEKMIVLRKIEAF